MPTIEFQGDDTAALEYIRKNNYASYSSIKNVRDKVEPQKFVVTDYFTYGTELHSRLLERKKLKTLSKDEEVMLGIQLRKLKAHPVVKALLLNAQCERKFHQLLYGVPVLGYIDIDSQAIGDLKTTRLTSLPKFRSAMDFLQASLYRAVTKKKDFYYIGVSKESPYDIMVFNVMDFQERIKASDAQLKELLGYIKGKIKFKPYQSK